MAIKDWPASERPRERLLAQGARALSDAELLAVFLRVGVTGRSALDLARDLLTRFQGLSGLFNAPLQTFNEIRGIGPAKYVQLQAVHELARRALQEDLQRTTLLSSSKEVSDYLKLQLARYEHEVFVALFLDAHHRLLATEELFRGTLTQAVVHPREVVKQALRHNAAAVILAHNHPSGIATPSSADEAITHMLKQALALVEVKVLDHIVIAANQSVSLAERGLM